MTDATQPVPSSVPDAEAQPMLNALTRQRLGRQLQAMYEPVIDEALDPRLAELLQQLDRDRKA
ncbi:MULTISPECIES: hypothetical protein [Methylobacterium]|uniref:hypothetical protein n=1 Tax=Methylobacterium TaxID=407 RepID=UPI0011C750CB|nr:MULTISPECIES: hypothetical protein [Methylobacterium]TXN23616.1 hypothetical protein FV217_06385 [Methylobacterium sp. WL9]